MNPADYGSRYMLGAITIRPPTQSMDPIQPAPEHDFEELDRFYHNQGRCHPHTSRRQRKVILSRTRWNDAVIFDNLRYPPIEERENLIRKAHQGHCTPASTYYAVKKMKVYWKGCGQDIIRYCSRCIPCAEFNNTIRKQPLRILDFGSAFSHMAFDLTGPLPTSRYGYRFIAVLWDKLIGTAFAFTLLNKSDPDIISNLSLLWSFLPTPIHVTLDNGFGSELFEYLSNRNIQIHTSSARFPQGNSYAEAG